MQTMNNSIPASGALPDNYQEVLSWKITGRPMRVIVLNILGVILFVIFGIIFSSIAIRLGMMPSEGNFRFGLGEMGLAVAGIVVTFILHELTHGLTMQMFGASLSGDMWITMIVLRYAVTAYVMDERDGIRVFFAEAVKRSGKLVTILGTGRLLYA